jgi:hypothetical protein
MFMTAQIGAVNISLTRLPTALALPDNFMLSESHRNSAVEHIQTSFEIFTRIFFHITNNPTGVFDDRYASEVKVYVVGDGSFSKEIWIYKGDIFEREKAK